MNSHKTEIENIDRIVAVCTGNICRSPMAWGFALRECEKRGLDITVESAGTNACEGYTPSLNSITACREKGIDISMHHARQIDSSRFTPTTLYAVMTEDHRERLHTVEGIPLENITVLGGGIPDPYGMPLEVYQRTCDAIEEAVIRLFDRITQQPDLCDDDLCIRRAAPEDTAAAAAIEQQCFSDPWSQQSFNEALCGEFSDFAVAVRHGEVCGYVVIYSVAGVSEMPKICTAPQARRQGVARSLLTWAEQCAAARGSTELTLEVRRSNLPAQSLYAACGFETVGIHPRFYSNPAEDAVIMTKELSCGKSQPEPCGE